MGAPVTKPGVSTKALNPPPPPPFSSSPPSSGPISTPFSASPPSAQPEQQSAWLQPTQAYPASTPPAPAPYTPPPTYQPPPAQMPQYTQPVPYQPSAPYPVQQPPYQAPPPPQTGQLPVAQYDSYGMPIAAPPSQYGQYPQYPQYGQPNQYVNVQITGAYPQGAYPTAQPETPAVVRSRLAFWGLWLLATAIAWAIALPAGFALWDAVQRPLLENLFRDILSNSSNAVLLLIISLAPFFAVVGAVVGLISGITQWVVFTWKGVRAGSWVFTSVIGWIVGAVVGWIVWVFMNTRGSEVLTGPSAGLLGSSGFGSGLYLATVFGAVAGLILGLVQLLSLIRHNKKAGLWLIASPVAWVITASIVVVVLNMLTQSSFGSQLNPVMSEVLYGAVIGTVAGATTGAALAAIV
ncbi:MAG TPA: hypothetical protein VJ183_10570 [Chloroflexia bacterium]|nr:hypothetical protein [Chloroflexia bacterium]